MNDATLNSDYFFLENVMQTVDGGRRFLKQVGAIVATGSQSFLTNIDPVADDNPSSNLNPTNGNCQRIQKRHKPNHEALPHKFRQLIQQAKERDVTLLVMPTGMERHKSNSTFYHAKSAVLFWKLEFVLHLDDATKSNPRILCHSKVSEESTIVHEWKTVAPNMECDVHFFIKVIPCPANQPQYAELNKNATIREALQGRTVVEYPTIYAVSPTQEHRFPRLIQEVK